MADDKSNFVLPNDQRFVELDSSEAFNNLTKQEKLYAHYLSQVCIALCIFNQPCNNIDPDDVDVKTLV